MAYVVAACRCLLALVFLAAAASKVRRTRFAEFTVAAEAITGLPTRLSRPAAALLVVAEVATASALVIMPAIGFGLAAVLLVGFLAGIVSSMGRRSAVRCRCFGGSGAVLGARHVTRNGALLAVALAGLVGVMFDPAGGAQAGGVAVSVLAGLLVGSLAIRFDDIVDVFVTS